MKSKTKGRLKLATLVACTIASIGAFGGSIYGTYKLVRMATDYQAQAVNTYRTEKYAEIDEAYANGEYDEATYIVKGNEIASRTNRDLIHSGMSDGSEEVKALLKKSNIGWAGVANFLTIPATAIAAVLSGCAANDARDELSWY